MLKATLLNNTGHPEISPVSLLVTSLLNHLTEFVENITTPMCLLFVIFKVVALILLLSDKSPLWCDLDHESENITSLQYSFLRITEIILKQQIQDVKRPRKIYAAVMSQNANV